jgi:hypothetical protein
MGFIDAQKDFLIGSLIFYTQEFHHKMLDKVVTQDKTSWRGCAYPPSHHVTYQLGLARVSNHGLGQNQRSPTVAKH